MKKLPDANVPEDMEAWKEEISGVEKLCGVEEPPQRPLIIEEINATPSVKGLYNHNSFKKIEIGEVADIDRNLAEKFTSGKLKIEARLDLHGLSEKQAFAKVCDFITLSYNMKRRCVLIVTGKGSRQGDWWEAKGVIRKSFPQWLNHADIRPYLLSVAQAKQEDGGAGAFYCLLKRHRD